MSDHGGRATVWAHIFKLRHEPKQIPFSLFAWFLLQRILQYVELASRGVSTEHVLSRDSHQYAIAGSTLASSLALVRNGSRFLSS